MDATKNKPLPEINIDELLRTQQLRHSDQSHSLRNIRIAVIVILLSLLVITSLAISGFLNSNTQKLKTIYHKSH